MSRSERRYRRWLRFYPKEYRHARGEEILTTLLEARSDRGRLSLADLLHITTHGTYVRAWSMARRWRAARLPRSVYVATLVIAILAALNLLAAAFPHNGPQNQSSHLDNIVVGFVFVGIDLLLWAWSRRLYPLAMGVLAVVVATSAVTVDLSRDVYAVVPLVLLVVGRKRYMARIPMVELPPGPRKVV